MDSPSGHELLDRLVRCKQARLGTSKLGSATVLPYHLKLWNSDITANMKTSYRSLAYLLVLLTLLVGALVPATAQEEDPPPKAEPGILELYVVDDNGEELFKASARLLLSESNIREVNIVAGETLKIDIAK